MNGLVYTQDANQLFQFQYYGGDLSIKQQDLYQLLVTNIIFMRCFLIPDLKTDIDFLTTRLKQTNLDNYKKLAYCVSYIRDTMEIPLTIEVSKASMMRWWNNSAYGVNLDIKGLINIRWCYNY